jgi:hypothetical protein
MLSPQRIALNVKKQKHAWKILLTSLDNSTPPSNYLGTKESPCEGETRRKKGVPYIPFLSESECALSMRGLAQLDEK